MRLTLQRSASLRWGGAIARRKGKVGGSAINAPPYFLKTGALLDWSEQDQRRGAKSVSIAPPLMESRSDDL